ncbi:MAG: hypothetical protein H6926_06165 [Chromatiales bacterium]|nr:hypothetical protein [Chromatiales bacterium]
MLIDSGIANFVVSVLPRIGMTRGGGLWFDLKKALNERLLCVHERRWHSTFVFDRSASTIRFSPISPQSEIRYLR